MKESNCPEGGCCSEDSLDGSRYFPALNETLGLVRDVLYSDGTKEPCNQKSLKTVYSE